MREIKQIFCNHDLQIRYILPYVKENKINISFRCKKCLYIFNNEFKQQHDLLSVEKIIKDIIESEKKFDK